MAGAAGKLFSGLVVGAAIGASVAMLLSSRTGMALPGPDGVDRAASNGPTPFEPANRAIERTRAFVVEVREQVRLAVAEGKATAAQTRAELTRSFEDAKRGAQDGDQGRK